MLFLTAPVPRAARVLVVVYAVILSTEYLVLEGFYALSPFTHHIQEAWQEAYTKVVHDDACLFYYFGTRSFCDREKSMPI